MSLEQLEQAVTQLPAEQLKIFLLWLDEFRADAWDRQIEADALAGKFDAINRKVDADIEAGRFTPL